MKAWSASRFAFHSIALVTATSVVLAAVGTGCCGGGTTGKANYPVDADDFDLGAVMSLVKDDQAKEASELERLINEEGSAINNVDVDEDGKTDYIVVREEREGDKINLEFLAVPSSTPDAEPDLIANIGFKKVGEEVEVEGGHPEYVKNSEKNYYRYRTAGSGIFMLWMMTPGRSYYRPAYNTGYYSRYNRRVTPRSGIGSKRGSAYKSMKVSPIAKKARPAAYSVASTRAKKTRSRFSQKKRTSFSRSRSKSLRKSGPSSRSRGFKSFGK